MCLVRRHRLEVCSQHVQPCAARSADLCTLRILPYVLRNKPLARNGNFLKNMPGCEAAWHMWFYVAAAYGYQAPVILRPCKFMLIVLSLCCQATWPTNQRGPQGCALRRSRYWASLCAREAIGLVTLKSLLCCSILNSTVHVTVFVLRPNIFAPTHRTRLRSLSKVNEAVSSTELLPVLWAKYRISRYNSSTPPNLAILLPFFPCPFNSPPTVLCRRIPPIKLS